jgi:GLPGLI family protein
MVKSLFFSLCCLCVLFSVSAQNTFEGMISFDIRYDSIPVQQKESSIYLPTNMYVLMKGAKQRMELKTIMGPSIIIIDVEKNESYALSSMMGKKIAMYISPEQNKQMKDKLNSQHGSGVPKVEYTNQSKTIAGYKCSKIIIQVNVDGKPFTFIAYYTKELPPIHSDSYSNLDVNGCILEYQLFEEGIQMTYTATGVDMKKLDDNLFSVPSDYQIVPYQIGY